MTRAGETGRRRPEGGGKIVITGVGGRLGGALMRIYSGGWEVVGLDRAALDLADAAKLREVLESSAFDVLINPAAMTGVDDCEMAPEEAEAVNVAAPGIMAAICRKKGARFIHVSTDYVFDGKSPGLRREEDPAWPLGVYGRTKRAGEKAVLEGDASALVVRTSWVFGPERPAFPDMVIGRALAGERVEAIADKWSAPTYADDFARYLEPLLGPGSSSGLLHLCNAGSCTWQEYGQAALDYAAACGLGLKSARVEALRLGEMKQFLAPRPVATAMDTARYRELGFGVPRKWQEALGEYVAGQVAAGKFRG